MDYPKISVISIIYKVAPYLEECLRSLVSQTYPNLEIILVVGQGKEDDGCTEIAERFAEEDERIKLVKCMAAGTGDARNRGLAVATGDFIGFVDGDDYIEKDMYEKLYSLISFHNADIAVCGKYTEYDDRQVADPQHSVQNLTGEGACRMILEGTGFFFHCWDKLFRAHMFEGITFPIVGQLEDRFIIGRIMARAISVVYDTTPLYHFRVHGDSVSHTQVNAEENTRADEIFVSIVESKYPSLKQQCEAFVVYDHITCLQHLIMNDEFTPAKAKKHIEFVRQRKKSLDENPYINRNTRIKIFLTLHFPKLLKYVTRKQG